MAEWLYEAGIGENRAALIQDGAIVEMRIERHDHRPRAGAVVEARLITRLPNSDRSVLALADGGGEVIGRVPAQISEGGQLRVVVTREAIPEAGNPKAPLVRPAAQGEPLSAGPSLLQRLRETGHSIAEMLPHQPDRLEAYGWSDRMAEAESGLVPFQGGLLRISVTPAMTLLDVDGAMPPAELTLTGAAAAACAVRLFDIGGSIGVDLPTPAAAGKPLRTEAGARIDAILPQPFERTAVNGFGFIQIVRPRLRPSLLELIEADSVTAAALALLRRAERASGRGAITLSAAPVVIRRIAREQGWQNELMRRRGAVAHLSERGGVAISGGHVEAEHP